MDSFLIGPCTVTPACNVVARGEKRISLEPKVMAVLLSLNARRGNVVARITLLDEVWNDDEAADDSLTRAISLLRKALGSLLWRFTAYSW
ncbi:MAG: winged helix-turn-helix domain-containing protein [Pseudomonadota bacterium]